MTNGIFIMVGGIPIYTQLNQSMGLCWPINGLINGGNQVLIITLDT